MWSQSREANVRMRRSQVTPRLPPSEAFLPAHISSTSEAQSSVTVEREPIRVRFEPRSGGRNKSTKIIDILSANHAAPHKRGDERAFLSAR